MENPVEKFLKAEQAAEELVETLKKLRDETISYKNSTGQLDAVREKLILFIEASQSISHDTKAAVELLKSIGGPEIHMSLTQLNGKIGDVNTEVKSTSKSLNDNFLKIDNKIESVSENDRSMVMLIEKMCLGLDTHIDAVNADISKSTTMLSEKLTGIGSYVDAVKLGIDTHIETVNSNISNSANILSEKLTGIGSYIETVETEMKSSHEQISNFLTTELKIAVEKIKLLIFVTIGVSVLALITNVVTFFK